MFSLFSWTKKDLGVVVVVLLIIFGVSTFQLKLGEKKSRDAQRRADTELVARGLKEYFKQNGRYPDDLDTKIVACGSRGISVCEWGDGQLVDGDSIVYVRNMPRDPYTDKGYRYIYEVAANKKMFRIYARLEYLGDSVVKSNLQVECGNGYKCNWYVE